MTISATTTWAAMLLVSLAQGCLAQEKRATLCILQETVAEGQQIWAEVEGVYYAGLDMGPLENQDCPGQATWVELSLRSERRRAQLRRILYRDGKACVKFEGKFYGAPAADENLPEAIRRNYHPGWGHLGMFRTKLVVHSIRRARAVADTDLSPSSH